MDDFSYLLRNKHRKAMLIAIYTQSRHYAELVEMTQLKPGSIYHHLRVLDPLIIKEGEGKYGISELGVKITESLDLVQDETKKPNVKLDYTKTLDNVGYNVFLGKLNLFLSILVGTSIILLGINGVALAGSAIYVVPNNLVFAFDLLAIILGWGIIYGLDWVTETELYNDYRYTFTIRLMSMVPGAIIGLGLYLLFLAEVLIEPLAFSILFAITVIFGLIVSTYGEIYLRSQSLKQAISFASIPIVIDILLGLVVLLSG